MSDQSQGPGWWLASDGRWYPPDAAASEHAQDASHATNTAPDPVAYGYPPGWWYASDGNWYPPQGQAAPAPPPVPVAAPVVVPAAVVSRAAPLPAAQAGRSLNTTVPSKAGRYLSKRSEFLPGEQVLAVVGQDPQILIATDRRLLVVKVGFTAGATGGGRTTAINYADVTAIQIQLGILMGSLSVQSPGYGATQTGDYWSQMNQRDPLKLPNVITWSKTLDKKFAQEVVFIRGKVDAARAGGTVVIAPNAGAPGLGDQLQHLAELHRTGALSDQEFAAAKARLIGQ